MDQQRSDATPAVGWCSILDAFTANARRYPDLVAVETHDRQLTYAKLAERVDAFAAAIAARVGAGNHLVGACLERDVDLPAWLLAILKAGCAYLPIDSMLPAARLAQVLEDAAPALIVANQCHAATLADTATLILFAEDVGDEPPNSDLVLPPIHPDALAYVIFTSGSTGRPKGVEIEHGSLLALMRTMALRPGLAAGEKMLGLTRLSFDLSVPDMFLPLYVGGSLALIDIETAADPDRLAAAFERFAPDLAGATPSLWRLLAESGWRGAGRLRIIAGGEVVTRALADRLLPGCRELWNIYGPTEATVWATIHHVVPDEHPVPIGRPTPGVTIRIADDELRPLATGEIGEILIGGDGVGRGYRGRPDLTAERFVTLDNGERVYRSGDFGRLNDAGDVIFLGRMDDQVKVRGYRIELGEIEAALVLHPGVGWSAARSWTSAAGQEVLVGYVVPRGGIGPMSRDLKSFLATRLPPYMVPDRIIHIDAMPLTANGKIDHAALACPFTNPIRSVSASEIDTIAGRLAGIWREVLGIDGIAEQSDFFDLGGYSLMTVRLARRIDATFGVKLAPIELLRHSTLAAMAYRIEHGGSGNTSTMLLNDGGNRAALFWLDAGSLMRTMARLLPPSQPAYSLNIDLRDEAALGPGAVSIAEVARRLRAHLVARQPVGPYYLGGWCRWAIVALELASQLIDDGEEVGLLIVLDAEIMPDKYVVSGFRSTLSNWLRPGRSRRKPPESFSQRIELAARTYRPRRYAGDVLLLRCEEASQADGWRKITDGTFWVDTVPGDHISMVRLPLVSTIAEALGSALARKQGQAQSVAIGAM